ncbi:hypothetical protein [Litorilituus sediminis]|uniref:Uncharacterized protein n=1 Tax=Litorilituus sediminis TaxID=718192 RepID=A0A4P6P5E5_9GAMM|nr:hypothetical protein [Litorilituus sediminis]QBG36198.1 hypothetical protein EMK97_10960 [Litorilituus sediminis]
MNIQLILLLSLFSVHLVVNAESSETKIQRAMAAAPSSISQHATIIDSDGTMLKKGSNGWTCMPDTMPGDKAPMCNDAVWMKMMKAVANKADFTATSIGISYMLKGDIGSGVSNSTPYHPDHKNADDYTETGPHMMIIVPKAMLEGLSRDPKSGGPYVMWGDTPYAHIMVPVK